MTESASVVATFIDHHEAELAVRKLADAGMDIKQLSIVGQGYHTDEKAVGFYNIGDRVKFWGKRGAFWGGLWGWFAGGIFLAVPGVGQVVVLGYLATALIAAIEGAVVVGGLSALGAALYSRGIPKDSVIAYENSLKADAFLVMARGSSEEIARAQVVLGSLKQSSIALHEGKLAA